MRFTRGRASKAKPVIHFSPTVTRRQPNVNHHTQMISEPQHIYHHTIYNKAEYTTITHNTFATLRYFKPTNNN